MQHGRSREKRKRLLNVHHKTGALGIIALFQQLLRHVMKTGDIHLFGRRFIVKLIFYCPPLPACASQSHQTVLHGESASSTSSADETT